MQKRVFSKVAFGIILIFPHVQYYFKRSRLVYWEKAGIEFGKTLANRWICNLVEGEGKGFSVK